MAKSDEVVTTETAEAPKSDRTEYSAVYIGSADVRVLTSEELSALGVTHKDPLRWDARNNKTVQLSKTNSEALAKASPTEFVVQ